MLQDFFKTLKEVVYQAYRHDLSKKEQKGTTFSLLETGKDATCTEAKFKKEAEKEILVFKFDQVVQDDQNTRQKEAFFFLSEGIARSKADYLLFYTIEHRGKDCLCAVICNMKSKNEANNLDQLNASESLAKFLVSTAVRLYNQSIQQKKNKNYITLQERNLNLKVIRVLFSDAKRMPVLNKSTKTQAISKKDIERYKCSSDVCDLELLGKKY